MVVPAVAHPPPSAVTIQCVIEAAQLQQVPFAALVAIMAAEGGQVGRVSINANRTYDIGPLQINSPWLRKLKRYGIEEALVLNNGCVNVLVGAWIFRQALTETRGDIWQAIGRYHSPDRQLAWRYQQRVYQLLQTQLRVEAVVMKANGSLNVTFTAG